MKFLFPGALCLSATLHLALLWESNAATIQTAPRAEVAPLTLSFAVARKGPGQNSEATTTESREASHAISEHNALIQDRIEYPDLARRMGWQGQVLLEVEVRAGSAAAIRVLQSSGHSVLDASARQAVGQHHFGQLNETIRLTFQYRLRDE